VRCPPGSVRWELSFPSQALVTDFNIPSKQRRMSQQMKKTKIRTKKQANIVKKLFITVGWYKKTIENSKKTQRRAMSEKTPKIRKLIIIKN
jgi:hypothetical protein